MCFECDRHDVDIDDLGTTVRTADDEASIILLAAMDEIIEMRPLRAAHTGRTKCLEFPRCTHPGCEALKNAQEIAQRARREAKEKLRAEARGTWSPPAPNAVEQPCPVSRRMMLRTRVWSIPSRTTSRSLPQRDPAK